MINAVTKLIPPAGVVIEFLDGAVFQVITNDQDAYRCLELTANGITLINPTVVGDRTTHTGGTGEHGHGIVLSGNNCTIINPTVSDCWGDGIAIYGGTGNTLTNVTLNNNRRNNLTITSSIDLLIDGALITNANGVNPQLGVDIEPNTTADDLYNVVLRNIRTSGNTNGGMLVSLATLINVDKTIKIEIDNHHDDAAGSIGSSLSLSHALTSASYLLDGSITVRYPYSDTPGANGIEVRNWHAVDTPAILIDYPFCRNPNEVDQASGKYGSGIAFYSEAGDGAGTRGNCTIRNPICIDDRETPRVVNAFHVVGTGLQNLHLIDPIRWEGMAPELMMAGQNGGVKVKDSFGVMTRVVPGGATTMYAPLVTKIHNEGAASRSDIYLYRQWLEPVPLTLENRTSFGLRIYPGDAGYEAACYPLQPSAGTFFETTEIGASITLVQTDDTEYYVDKVIGVWTGGGAGGGDITAIHDDTASEISAITEKTAPVGADMALIEDSAAANVKKMVQLSNLGLAIKLDDLAAPDDTTDLDVSTSLHGLTPKAPNVARQRLDGTGSWVVPGVDIGVKDTSYGVTSADNLVVFTNEGALGLVTFTLPTAVAGLQYSFVTIDGDGIRIDANTGDTIRIDTAVSASAGYIQGTTIGETITLVAVNATEWVALSYVGTWTIDS